MGTTVIGDSRRGRNYQLEPPRVEPPMRRPRARALWWLAGLVLLASSLAWGVYTLVTVIAHEERTETTRFGAQGVEVLDVNSDGGRVTVTGRADLDEIVITADIGEGLRRTGNRQEISTVATSSTRRAPCSAPTGVRSTTRSRSRAR